MSGIERRVLIAKKSYMFRSKDGELATDDW
jgi:hypothetical protein